MNSESADAAAQENQRWLRQRLEAEQEQNAKLSRALVASREANAKAGGVVARGGSPPALPASPKHVKQTGTQTDVQGKLPAVISQAVGEPLALGAGTGAAGGGPGPCPECPIKQERITELERRLNETDEAKTGGT